ncbi:MAG: hypothetical protein ABJA78_13505 [Ferruginibacter sp.]
MIFKKDNFLLGLILGLLAPFVGFFFVKYKVFGSETSYTEALHELVTGQLGHSVLTVALSLCLLANAVIFTIYINSHIDKTARGIFAATCVYGLLILSIKTFL